MVMDHLAQKIISFFAQLHPPAFAGSPLVTVPPSVSCSLQQTTTMQTPMRLPPPGQLGAQPPMMMAPPPDPVTQAVIDSDFHPVDIKFGPPDNYVVLSGANSQEKDPENNLDFTGLNRLTKLLVTNPNIRCPPPPNVVSQKLSTAINNTKEEGNV